MTATMYEVTRTGSGRWIVSRFDSVAELVAAVDDPAARSAGLAQETFADLNRQPRGEDWTGLSTPAQQNPEYLRQLIAAGWPEGAARIQQLAGSIDVPPVKSVRRRARWSAEGDSVDIHRVWGGRLDQAWRRTVRQQVRAPAVVTIVADITALAHVEASELFWRGAAVIALADALQTAGYNVEIIAASCSTDTYKKNKAHSAHFVSIKPATAPVERNTLAATLALAYFNRGVVFSHRALHPTMLCDSGVGCSTTARKAGLLPAGAIDGVDKVKSLATAQEWIASAITALAEPAAAE